VAALAAMTLSGCASSPAKTLAPTSIVEVPVKVAKTSMGDVGYRVLGHGPDLVLVMGYAGTMEVWDPHFVDVLARHFRVVVFDNAGIGATSALKAPLSIDAMADQTSALITALRLKVPDVLGWSMGSMIAQALAVRHPNQVHRLVLCAAFPGVGSAVQPSQADVAVLTGDNPAAAQADLFPTGQTLAADAFGGALSAYPSAQSSPAKVIAAQKAAVLAWFDGRDPAGREASRIVAPTLVADGASDRIDVAANDRAVAREIRGSRLVLYGGAGHAFLSQEGANFTFLVRAFLVGSPAALTLSQFRRDYLADYKTVTAAGYRWVSSLKTLTSSTSAQDLARIDLRVADAYGAFDDELLAFGASGALGQCVHALVDADVLVSRDFLALSDQTGQKVGSWTKTLTADGLTDLARQNALRRQLNLPPVTTTTTTTSTTTTPSI
jgi:pimeloyl-ACP methyl ester carboxylesterase